MKLKIKYLVYIYNLLTFHNVFIIVLIWSVHMCLSNHTRVIEWKLRLHYVTLVVITYTGMAISSSSSQVKMDIEPDEYNPHLSLIMAIKDWIDIMYLVGNLFNNLI